MPPVQWPVASLLAFASWEGWDEFLETEVSHPLGGAALSSHTGAQAVKMTGLCCWRKSPGQRKAQLEYQSALTQVG